MAFYEFENLADAKRGMESDAIGELSAEFDRHWRGKVTCTRDP